jgi:hypothetical protein
MHQQQLNHQRLIQQQLIQQQLIQQQSRQRWAPPLVYHLDGLLPTSPATLGDYKPPLQAIEYYQPPPPPRANLFAMPMTFVQSSAPYYQPRITINFGPTVIHQHALNVPQPHPTPVDSDRGYAEILRGGNGANGGSRGRAKRRTRRNRR